jgi:hypothetical protein
MDRHPMTQPRSSLAIALQDYKGPRPGIALTIAAVALLAAIVVGAWHVIALGGAAAQLRETEQTVRTLNRYNAALEVWRQMASERQEFAAQERLRDSLGIALRTELAQMRAAMTDSTDRALVGEILGDLQRPEQQGRIELGSAGREEMIVLTARQESTLLAAAAGSQRARIVGAVIIALAVLAAGVLIIPMSWLYVQYKRGVPLGA